MFYDNYKSNEYDFNECSSKGTCSISPNVSSIQEIIFVLIRETAHYVKKLKRLGNEAPQVETEILNALAEFISVAEYTDDDVLITLQKLNRHLNSLQRKYNSICKKKNINCSEISEFINLDDTEGLSSIIALGEKLYLRRINKLSAEEKFYSDIMLLNLKSISINTLKLADYGVLNQEALDKIIDSLNLYNFSKLPLDKIEKSILELTKLENKILNERARIQSETFGPISETVVSTSTRKNNAVLVSGSSLLDLYNFLEYTKDEENLDVYSHGDLLVAHAFEKFKNFKHFVGHYGTSNENCIFDFATFPGSILLTKHSKQNIEHLIRGRIFTMDTVQPKGATKVNEKEFAQIVESARIAKGFKKGQIRNDVITGFNESELDQKLETISEKLDKGDIKRIVLVGMSAKSTLQEIYLNDIIKNLSNDTYIISFSKLDTEHHHLEVNIANNFPLMYTILEKIFKKIKINSENIRFFLQKCDPSSIAGIIQLKNYGAKKIMIANCPPTIMNPSILTTFAQKYHIDIISSPKQDAQTLEN
ncbi:MAG: hypothetical protein NC390_00275 [Fusobacterium sp.]|nr:hypothetical protein [Fusobacterium sp.]